VEARIARAIDEQDLVRLKGNTHRLAWSQFDQGIAPPSRAMDGLRLVLTRSTQQDTVPPSAPGCDVTRFSANPNPITTTGGLGHTTITVATACTFDVRIGSPSY
jgi:hypothetical protein